MTAGELAIPRQAPEPATTESRPIRFGEAIRGQFRQLMRRITRPAAPKPKARRRRTEDIRGGFRLAAINFMRRAVRVVHIPLTIWDTLTWLRHWEFHYSAEPNEIYEDAARSGGAQESSDLSPHP
jgi:hypothetical protein